MNLTLDSGVAVLLGATIAGFFSIITLLIQGRRERKAWERNQESERSKWTRDDLHEINTNARYCHVNVKIGATAE